MFVKFMLLATLAYLAILVASQGEIDSRCPPDNIPRTLLIHDTNCTLYYICHFGERHLMPQCPPGMVFHPVNLACVTGNACIDAPPTEVPTIEPDTDAPTEEPTEEPLTDEPTTVGPETAPPVIPTVPPVLPTVSTTITP